MSELLTVDDLHSYQSRAAEFIRVKKRCGLLLEMGLGKTGASLTAIVDLRDRLDIIKPLIIGPKLVVEVSWIDEVKKWAHTKGLTVSLIAGTAEQRQRAARAKADLYLVSRDNIRWLIEYLADEWSFDAVFVDESSSFKSPSSKRFKAMRKIAPKVDYMVILTGTPAPNGYLDLWSQIHLLDFGERLGRTFTAYKQRFFQQDYSGFNWTLREGMQAKIDELLSDICMSMQVKDYLEVKEPVVVDRYFELLPPEQKAYRALERDYLHETSGDKVIEAPNAAVLTGKLRQYSAGALYTDDEGSYDSVHKLRMAEMKELVAETAGDNLLVAYHYKFERAQLEEAFPDAVHIHEKDAVARWNRGEIKMLLAHPASAGHGLNLQKGGRRIVWYTIDYPLELYQQFNARLARQGQTRGVFIHRLLARGTIDMVIAHKVLEERNATQKQFLDALREQILKS